ncbi:hypothetical protein EV129_118112 [Rhizobium azibense]|uniref:Uncharacterized protein n=1 Tax=Rhizobium azibense TaxID=1136135 RepID=A0A4R3RBT6_9HYPH|nr:hypothetical protein EV129_118112 [Rhizobium azibense]
MAAALRKSLIQSQIVENMEKSFKQIFNRLYRYFPE